MAKSKYKQLEEARGRPVADILREEFDQHGTQRAVAASLGITQGTVSLWLSRLGLTTKTVLVPTADNGQTAKAAPTPDKSSAA